MPPFATPFPPNPLPLPLPNPAALLLLLPSPALLLVLLPFPNPALPFPSPKPNCVALDTPAGDPDRLSVAEALGRTAEPKRGIPVNCTGRFGFVICGVYISVWCFDIECVM